MLGSDSKAVEAGDAAVTYEPLPSDAEAKMFDHEEDAEDGGTSDNPLLDAVE